MQEIKLNKNEIVQTKIFCGYSSSVENRVNNWLKENTDKIIIDIKSSNDDSYLYIVIIYK